MPNRAERRAQEKQAKRKGSAGSAQERNRAGRTVREEGMSEEALQRRSMHLQTSGTDEWKPSSSTSAAAKAATVIPEDYATRNPERAPKPTTARGWGRFFGWLFIVLSAIAFIVVMFIPDRPLAAIVTVSVIFVLGVLSLFIFGGESNDNPNVDSNGTAV